MTGLIADLRHAFVVYRGTPIASALAVLALAVAMAFVSAFLSMWSDLSLKPPAGFEVTRGLVTIGQRGGYAAADSSTPLTLNIVEGMNETLNSLRLATGVATFPQLLHRDDEQVPLQAEAVTRHFSDLVPRLQLGRPFEEQDHQADAAPVAILSDRLWREQFGGDTDVLGRSVTLSQADGAGPGLGPATAGSPMPGSSGPRGQDYRIVGVMAPEMTGTFADAIDVWLPYEQVVPFLYGDPDARPQFELGAGVVSTTGGESVPTRMRGLAQLASGIGIEAASSELNDRFAIEGQAFVQGLDLSGEAMSFDLIDGVVRDIATHRESERQVSLFLAGALLLVLVAACNISLFLLARATRRQRELGIRMAVGASAKRLARQLASEAGLLMIVATALGVLISLWLSVALRELPFLQQAEWRNVSPFDWRVLAMLSGLMLLLTLLVSLAPILGIKRMGIKASSGMVTARAGWGQRLVGTAQIALTGIVGAVAVAFAWHLVFYATADRGFDAEDVLVVDLEPGPVGGPFTDQAGLIVERERRREVIASLPGVENVSFATSAPGGAGTLLYTIVQRETGRYVEIGTVRTDEHYIGLLDLPLMHGASFDPGNPLQIVVNEAYAIEYFGQADAAVGYSRGNRPIVGVLRDVAFGHPAEAILPMGITTWPQASYPIALIKTQSSPADMRRMLQQKIDAGELELDIGDVHRLEELTSRDLRPDRARMALTGISALMVIALAALGFYGTQRYLVSAGQREYAIRSSIGAGPRALRRLVAARSLMLALPGVVLGGLLALIAVALLRDGFVAEVVSPVTVTLLVLLVVVAIVLAATVGPAEQARRTAPAELLRVD